MLCIHPQGQLAIYAVAHTPQFGGMEVLEDTFRVKTSVLQPIFSTPNPQLLFGTPNPQSFRLKPKIGGSEFQNQPTPVPIELLN